MAPHNRGRGGHRGGRGGGRGAQVANAKRIGGGGRPGGGRGGSRPGGGRGTPSGVRKHGGDRGGRGPRRGGRGPRPEKKPKTKEELDAEMDDYFLKDGKTAAQKLNSDLDDYWKTKPAGEGAAAEPEAEAPAEEEAVAEEEAAAE